VTRTLKKRVQNPRFRADNGLSNWQTVRDQGLTAHANWWPAIYQGACKHWRVSPDTQALAFAETYEGARADLKVVAASG